MRETRLKSFGDYLALLERGDRMEWEKFVNSLTTNLTSFFREPHHFPILAEHLKKLQGKSPIKIWCSAASTGEEPYSIAMTAVETFNSFNVPVSIVASDLDTNVLATAAKAVYAHDRVDKISPERLSRFFVKGTGAQSGTFSIKPELRRLVTFQRLNLLEPNWAIRGPIDAFFCRNVMIYFDQETKTRVVHNLLPRIKPNGHLIIGHSETLNGITERVNSVEPTIYRKP